ncbi:hypothetical protein ASG56_20735 [Rhodococcus sp. Leaf7]|uniref:DUF5134 domain-containing protein n=1 Tax=unclassified Rhodococcus (in: high G+C Gram-positive bacteria) TaxID=192944 RepID=UPI0006FA2665|nr:MULTISPECIES: DUF5134 domain-containing protein [unclassified Rhodococcus (in: high G+C Gram-positive bacteria)]KQU01948.1 hypothetical protein ASG56_20735 [Rhodococcus sp. Leaf7]KQU38241.1 hypothetical protein ASG64_20705 [Rhodococcus sp. Leaf247]
MIADGTLRWICTALFVAAAGYCVSRLAHVGRTRGVIDHGLHLAMCVAMIAMAWPWGLGVPLLPQGVFFGAATLWFVFTAAQGVLASVRRRVDVGRHGPVMAAYHAFMMAAMVWMVVVMAGWLPDTAAHDHSGGDSMAGDASAHAHHAAMETSARTSAGSEWVSLVSYALTLAFAAAAILWLHRMFAVEQDAALAPTTAKRGAVATVGRVYQPLTLAAACEVAMAGGMAIMMGVM